jgi:hypothetical protein
MKKVIKGEDLKKTKKWAKEVVKRWHSKDPDYVFLTETSGPLYGYVLKDTWKKAYPNEKPPEFFRINPDSLWYRTGENKKLEDSEMIAEEEKYFKKRIKKKDPNIIVFDEGSKGNAKTMEDFSLYSKNNKLSKNYKFNRSSETEGAAAQASRFIHEFLEDNDLKGELYTSKQGNVVIRQGSIGEDQDSKFSKNPTSKFGYRSSYRPTSEDEDYQYDEKFKQYADLTGAIVKHPKQRKRAMAYVKELKEIGKEAGEELAHKRGLEKRLTSIIALAGLGAGIFFFSPTLTGNAIANLTTKTSSIIGAGLFIVGIVGSYFWFKKR